MKQDQLCKSGHTIFKESCTSCKALKREWYQALASTNFIDIEKNLRLVDHKTTLDLSYVKDFHTQAQFDAKQNYYIWAEHKLNENSFRSLIDKKIWALHAENTPQRQMTESIGLERSWISRKIKHIEGYLKSGHIGSVCMVTG